MLRIENYPSKLKRVKSRNQGFLDLTIPLTKKSIYKYSSQAKAWGSNFYLWRIIILPVFGSQVFFLQGKED